MTKKIKWAFILVFISMSTSFAVAEDKTTNFKCKGIATFELMGSSGKKRKLKQCLLISLTARYKI